MLKIFFATMQVGMKTCGREEEKKEGEKERDIDREREEEREGGRERKKGREKEGGRKGGLSYCLPN